MYEPEQHRIEQSGKSRLENSAVFGIKIFALFVLRIISNQILANSKFKVKTLKSQNNLFSIK